MPKSLVEYADWLDGREVIWPKPPRAEPVSATPYLKPLAGIRAITWNVYGTLLRIADGQLLHDHPQQLRMQVALEKTIEEFNMWQSMGRKPGAPWESMYEQYKQVLAEHRMAGTKQKGDVPEVNSAVLWRKLIGRLEQKDYKYDSAFYGDPDQLSEKVAYFFHKSLQGVEAASNASAVLVAISRAGLKQGLLADAQVFTLAQLLRALKAQGTPTPLSELFDPACLTLSYQQGTRKPSRSLYAACIERLETTGVEPGEVLHVGSRMQDDLIPAKQAGLRTVLYAGEKSGLQATSAELRDPATKPDRLITNLIQLREILSIG